MNDSVIQGRTTGVTRLDVNLVFDPASLPTKSDESDCKRGHGQSGPLTLKLRFERDPTTNSAVLIGRLLTLCGPTAYLGDLSVGLSTGDRAIALTTTNRLGEFRLEYEPGDSLRLVLVVPGDRILEVAWAGV